MTKAFQTGQPKGHRHITRGLIAMMNRRAAQAALFGVSSSYR